MLTVHMITNHNVNSIGMT